MKTNALTELYRLARADAAPEVLRLYAENLSHKKIAKQLGFAPRWVRTILIENRVWQPGKLMSAAKAATLPQMGLGKTRVKKDWEALDRPMRPLAAKHTEKVMDLPLFGYGQKVKRRPKQAAYMRDLRTSSPEARIRMTLKGRILSAIKSEAKTGTTMELLGCTIAELREHIESLWLPGMTWANHGIRGWHIDHIRPCSSFDLTDPKQQGLCFHWTNMQPLWGGDNIRKSNHWKN